MVSARRSPREGLREEGRMVLVLFKELDPCVSVYPCRRIQTYYFTTRILRLAYLAGLDLRLRIFYKPQCLSLFPRNATYYISLFSSLVITPYSALQGVLPISTNHQIPQARLHPKPIRKTRIINLEPIIDPTHIPLLRPPWFRVKGNLERRGGKQCLLVSCRELGRC